MTDLVTNAWTPDYAKDKNRPYVGEPWNRQPHESSKAHAALKIFIDLGEQRTIAAAMRVYCERNGLRPMSNASNWARKHRWQERADAYDAYVTAKEVAALKRQRIKAATRHAKQAEEIQSVLMLPMNKLRERIKANGDEFSFIDGLGDEELMKLARAFALDVPNVARAEREALGSVTDAPAVNTKIIAERGAILKRVLGSPDMINVLERLTVEQTTEQDDEATG